MFQRYYSMPLKATFLIALGMVLGGLQGAQAQDRLYRCDNNYYTNNLNDPKASNCKAVEGGNVTVVQGTRAAPVVNPAPGVTPGQGSTAPRAASGPAPAPSRVDNNEQKARDSEARTILESELRKAEARRDELSAEFNNGEPERRGDETRNYQKYLDRVNNLKSGISRIESDIAGIRRELGRTAALGNSAVLR